MLKTPFYIKEDNSAVQDFYVDIVGKALEKNGFRKYKTISLSEALKLNKNCTIICISHYTVAKLAIKGFKNLLYWVQGTSPDESYMRNHSKLRWLTISMIEWFALKKANFVFMVSKGMLNHYNSKYHNDFSNKTYIMPCYNSELDNTLFETPCKYTKNIFCYVGGLSVWQCFEETVDLYKSVEDIIPNCELRIFTGEQEKANQILKSKGVRKFEVKYVVPNQLASELAPCKYGFIVRGESPVNYVATPTKLSNYMAAGLIPIVSNTVSFFSEILGKAEYAIVLDGKNDKDRIVEQSRKSINDTDVYNEYRLLFDKFYNTQNHIQNISNRIKHLF